MKKRVCLKLTTSLLFYVVWKFLFFILYLITVKFNIQLIENINQFLPKIIASFLSLVVVFFIFIFLRKKNKRDYQNNSIKIKNVIFIYVLLSILCFFFFLDLNLLIFGKELSIVHNNNVLYIE